MAEVMSQEEIDRLLHDIQNNGEVDIDSPALAGNLIDEKTRGRLESAKLKLDFHRQNYYPWEVIRADERELHRAGHLMWLARHGISRSDYIKLIRRILKERGLVWCPQNPPGYKLMKATS